MAVKLAKRKSCQVRHYNKRSRPLQPLECGQAIRMKLPGCHEWSLGTCTRILNNKSYEVEVCGRQYHRNRHHLQFTLEKTPPLSQPDFTLPDPPSKPEDHADNGSRYSAQSPHMHFLSANHV